MGNLWGKSTGDDAENTGAPQYDFSKFKLEKILSNNTTRKVIYVLGSFPDISEADRAIVLLEKTAFRETDVADNDEARSYFSRKTLLKTEFINNIYGSFECFPQSDINGVKTTVIYPATEKHIEKYSTHEKYIFLETPDLYENITKRHIEKTQFSLGWVYNILEHKSEQERIIFEDSDPEKGFILLPDLKWDGRTLETMYVLALPHKRDIKSLRELDGSHLPLLKNIRDAGCDAIKRTYGLSRSRLRIYFHYQPSFYHLHVHFNPCKTEAPGIFCEKSHLLDTVINNLELAPDYYKRATLSFVAYEGDKLTEMFQKELQEDK